MSNTTDLFDDVVVVTKVTKAISDFFSKSGIESYRKTEFITKVRNTFFDLALAGHRMRTRGRSIYEKIKDALDEDIVVRYVMIDFKSYVAFTVKIYDNGGYYPMSMMIPLYLVCNICWDGCMDILDHHIFNSDLKDVNKFKDFNQFMKSEEIK